MSQPLETTQPRLRHSNSSTLQARASQYQRSAAEKQEGFYLNFIADSGNILYQAFVYLSQRLRMTHQKSTVYPYVGAAAYHAVRFHSGYAWRYLIIL